MKEFDYHGQWANEIIEYIEIESDNIENNPFYMYMPLQTIHGH